MYSLRRSDPLYPYNSQLIDVLWMLSLVVAGKPARLLTSLLLASRAVSSNTESTLRVSLEPRLGRVCFYILRN